MILSLSLTGVILAALGLAGAVYSYRAMPGTPGGVLLSVGCSVLSIAGVTLAVVSFVMASS